MSAVAEFVTSVTKVHATGEATEHSYRHAIKTLIESFADGLTALNEPRRIACGAPDFIVNRRDVPIGHIEAKDLHINLRGMKRDNREQQDRYRAALPNLIYTNCLDWDFYRDGRRVSSTSIGTLNGSIQPDPEAFDALSNHLREFVAQNPATIFSPQELAQRMAGKAQLIKDVLGKTLREDKQLRTELAGQYQAFQTSLIHDITPEDFADIYAETIAYGMFAARLHDPTPDSFSRQEALELLPRSNPFLRKLFQYIAGYDLDERIAWIIDDLARVFRACDVAKLMSGFGKLTGQNDPFLHFYETFLAAYNPKKRKARGVWYTPEPVVKFIVRAVDQVLQTEFGLPQGLADTSKVTVEFDTGQEQLTQKGARRKDGRRQTVQKDVHRVQILDPATGTGTFLAEVIKQIAPKVQGVAPGMWSRYIEQDLIPRLHGFELLMASYAMCHMKLDMILTELGYNPTGDPPRLSVYLTNSLEEGEQIERSLPFTRWLSDEARKANEIKRDMPIMCVIGNPPYLGEGGKSEGWLGTLMDDYKKEPGGKRKLQERNPKWLNDLYVKFIRLSSHLIEKNGEGVIGFITNHGYLDNPTFRGMRWHLMKTFDRIWVLDLHGNAKKKEVTPDGAPDKNVFDIQQGVAIIIAVKRQDGGDGLAEVMHGDLWGKRDEKYGALSIERIADDRLVHAYPQKPYFLFVPRDYEAEEKYNAGIDLKELFSNSALGFQTHRDHFAIQDSRQEVTEILSDMQNIDISDEDFHNKYATKDNRDWKLHDQRILAINSQIIHESIQQCIYRPFDFKWCDLSYRTMDYPRPNLLKSMKGGKNLALLIPPAAFEDWVPARSRDKSSC